ncbi:MAG: DUF349 domain-containing protein [Bacteroidota bacterium]
MEPKDLKNSEELNSKQNSDLKNSEQTIAPKDEINAEETTPQKKDSVEKTEKKEKAETQKKAKAKTKTEVKEKAKVEDNAEEEKEIAQPEEKSKVEVEEQTQKTGKETAVEKAETKKKSKKEEPKKKVAEKTEEVEAVTDNKEEKSDDKDKKEEIVNKEEKAAKAEKDTKEEPNQDKEDKMKDSAKVEKPVEKEKEESIDYTAHTQIELVNALRDILDENGDKNIKYEVETIKAVFYKNLNQNITDAKNKFIEEGGEEQDFKAEQDPYENDIKDLLKRYRGIRIEFNKKLEIEKEENLKLKYQVIEEIKGLINNEESINKTFHDFKELQKRWRELGLVPQSKMKNLWDTYHFHVENFYDYVKINRELRDLDLKKNLETKLNLCERAEELLVEPSIIKAFNTLQKYHELWREIGPVPRENKDDIWERFKAATSKINKKHQEFFENRKTEQKKNLEAKTALCEKVEKINEFEITNHKEWDEKSKELIELQKLWRTIGFAPRKDNNIIYDRFRTACDKFFDAKREFYAKNKEIQQNNLQLKIDLCVQAEALKDNTDWKKTTQDFISIQKKWKEIGPVPRKHSDNIWRRFRAACDHFFDKKSEHFSSMDTEQVDNLKLKEQLIEEVMNFKPATDVDENLNTLKDFQRRWTEIGHVPYKKKDEIQSHFRDAINKMYDELNIDEDKRNLLKFRSKMSSFSESTRGQNKMRMEREKYMNKLKQLENDLVLLDNNIGFFAESKNAESLIKDVQNKIEVTRQKIEFLKNKIRVIDEMDSMEE